MKKMTFLALAMSLGLMSAQQASATIANPGMAAAATATQAGAVTKVWWRGGPGWRGGWRPGYGWRAGYGWVPFAAVGAAAAATGAYYYYNRPYYGPGPYYYGPGPYYGPCGAGPCAPPAAPIK